MIKVKVEGVDTDSMCVQMQVYGHRLYGCFEYLEYHPQGPMRLESSLHISF